ncbi:MAG: transposase [Deltaproteobacteria bacterium]|nr:transposase [Deltaproteobacteria bacterium]
MPNHVHLLIQQREIPLSKIMQGIMQSYAMYHNRKYGKTGHLFQGRYKAILCDKDAYLLELIRYLHLNPVRGNIVGMPDKSIWSSHKAYLDARNTELVDAEFPLSIMAANKKAAVAAYKNFMNDGLNIGHVDEFYNVKEQIYLGDDEFVEEIENRTKKTKERSLPVELAMDEVVQEVSRLYKVPPEEIKDRSRCREGARLRAVVVYAAMEAGGISMTEAARYLGRDPSTISIAVKQLKKAAIDDKTIDKRLSLILSRIRKGRKIKYQINKV